MAKLIVTRAANEQFMRLPVTIRARVLSVYERLEAWPQVSGAKPLRGDLAGNYRIRTGDWRVVFRVEGQNVVVWRIDNRKDVYRE